MDSEIDIGGRYSTRLIKFFTLHRKYRFRKIEGFNPFVTRIISSSLENFQFPKIFRNVTRYIFIYIIPVS